MIKTKHLTEDGGFLNQADYVLKIAGGAKAVAEMLNIGYTRVWYWAYREGTSGLIPVKFHKPILEGCKARGIDLRPDDFFFQRPDAVLTVEAKSGGNP